MNNTGESRQKVKYFYTGKAKLNMFNQLTCRNKIKKNMFNLL